ncbi:aminotransferase class III-fold pyridoxal phosphate-dependent enzyme [Paucibacter sp. APW11]|uniref:Aminotransferase class III-fold pyridoxal phosphate-dependent enzyme n=1 Tax=Roseateles aquae TaxID=3077235 RepID=A0ABU3P7M0_9BURK|nr:aminotransferase class III-fold pyridoxal phosphate-dependent enzyme [Paucibacter sp. APW11]MDT8997736.1 aminotransferase class III-fold pyridoxal phosphate-dependent enzyme [Paucibacter sp. APW11]
MEHLVGQATLSREQLLAHAGLLVEYSRARGNWLDMDDGHGELQAVLDLVGGFGACLLGHNHPELQAVLQGCLQAQKPFLAQGSLRRQAGELKQALASYLLQHTGQDYSINLLSTGTEAVEAAIKHAGLAYCKRLTRLGDALAANVRALQTRVERGSATIDEDFLRDCERQLGREPLSNLDELLSALAAHNQQALDTEPFIASFEYAFHGKTLGALAVTWNRDARLPFIRNNPNAVFITDPSRFLDAVSKRMVSYYEFEFEPLRLTERRHSGLTALIYEPVQGEGGVVELDEQRAALLHELRQRHPEVAIIADEIQCGLGRTGRPVESQARGLPNDYLCFSKSLGGGLTKVSALAVRSADYHPEFGLLHTSTFAEDDLSSAVARRTLEIIQRDGIAARCEAIGHAFLEGLQVLQRRWPKVLKAVRGRGCMLGIELADFSQHPSAVLSSLSEEKLLGIVCAGYLLHEHRVRILPSMGRRGVLRIQPSAYLQADEMQLALQALNQLCERLQHADVAGLVAYLAGGPRPTPGPDAPRHAAKPEAFEHDDGKAVERIGFIAHLIDANSIRQWDPALAGFDDEQLDEMRQQVQPVLTPRIVARRRVRSALGREVELLLYGVLMDSQAIDTDMRFNKSEIVRRQVRSAYRQARLDGCSLVGFGGYTSIVTANCTEFDEEHPAVTTGNALTVASSIASMRAAAQRRGIALADARIAIVGAAGNIGHVHATLLASECAALSLVGRPGSRSRLRVVAEDVAGELLRRAAQGSADREAGALIQRARTIGRGLSPQQLCERLLDEQLLCLLESTQDCRDADIVICASNSPAPILDARCFAADKPVLICDLAMPGDVDKASVRQAQHLTLIRGGVVDLPMAPDFSLPGMLLDPGQVYACAGETLLLGLAGVRIDFSKGPIRAEQVREIEALARLHGFALGRDKTTDGF